MQRSQPIAVEPEAASQSSLLHIAVERGWHRLTRILMQLGYRIDVAGDQIDSPLKRACAKKQYMLIKIMLEETERLNSSALIFPKLVDLLYENRDSRVLRIISLYYGGDFEDIIRLIIIRACREDNVAVIRFFKRHRLSFYMHFQDQNLPIHMAVQLNSIHVLNELRNVNYINSGNQNDDSPLHLACKTGNIRIAKFLLKHGAMTLIQNNQKQSPLDIALEKNNTKLIKLLLEHDSDLYRSIQLISISPMLEKAIQEKNHSLIYVLMLWAYQYKVGPIIRRFSHIIDYSIEDEFGNTLLHQCCEQGYYFSVQVIMKTPELMLKKNKLGQTPLELLIDLHKKDKIESIFFAACRVGHVELVQAIHNHGLKINKKNDFGRAAIHIALDQGHAELIHYLIQYCDMNLKDKHGDTPLHIACRKGDLSLIKKICAIKNIKINALNHERQSPIQLLASKNYREIIQFMISVGADVNVQDHQRQTFLHYVCFSNDWDMFQFLLSQRHINLNMQNDNEETPLHVSAWIGHARLVSALLLQDKIEIRTDRYGRTPLHVACTQGKVESIKVMIDSKKFDLKSEDINGDTVLHIACSSRKVEVVSIFLNQSNFNLNQRNLAGNTPLNCAVNQDAYRVVELLLKQKKLNLNIPDAEGMTPFMNACVRGNQGIVEQFIEDPRTDFSKENNEEKNLLHLICERSSAKILKLILQACELNPFAEDYFGNTPLDYARATRDYDCVLLLIQNIQTRALVDLEHWVAYEELTEAIFLEACQHHHSRLSYYLLSTFQHIRQYAGAQRENQVAIADVCAEYQASYSSYRFFQKYQKLLPDDLTSDVIPEFLAIRVKY